jgi:hypothetical protein
MPSFKTILLSLLAATVSSTVSASAIYAREAGSLELPGSSIPELVQVVPPTPTLTNAKRMALGMPPLPPVRRGHGRRHGDPAPSPVALRGRIAVNDAKTGASHGFIGEELDSTHHFGVADDANALLFRFSVPAGSQTSGQLDITSDATYSGSWPYMGGILNSDDQNLKPGSANFAYIQGTTRTDPDATQSVSNSWSNSKKAESAIWSYNPNTKEITAEWVNSDSDSEDVRFILNQNQTPINLVITGDSDKYLNDHKSDNPIVVKFTFVPV